MTLVERDLQLRRLEAALEAARQGQGTTVLVSGEAGIGKTSLLQELADGASSTSRVLVGTCEDLDHQGRRAEVLLGRPDRLHRPDRARLPAGHRLPALARAGTADPDASLPAGFEGQRLQFELLVLAPLAAVVAACTVFQLTVRSGRPPAR